MPVANFFDFLNSPHEKHIDYGFSVNDFLEASFEFIDSRRDSFQFLFPSDFSSGNTPSPLRDDDIAKIRSSDICKRNYLRCLSKMFKFYGLELEHDHNSLPSIKASEELNIVIRNYKLYGHIPEFKWILDHNNSHLMIAQIINSCELLGFNFHSEELRCFLAKNFSSSQSSFKLPIDHETELLWKINDHDLDLKELLLGFDESQNTNTQTEENSEEQSDDFESHDKKLLLSKRVYPHYGVGNEELADKIIRGAREYAKTSGGDPSSFIKLATLAHKQKIFDEIKSLQQETFSKFNEKLARNVRIMQLLDPETLHSIGVFFNFNNDENSGQYTMIPGGSQFIFRINSCPDAQLLSVSKKIPGETFYSQLNGDDFELLNRSLEFKISEALSKIDPSKKDFHRGQSLLEKEMERGY